MSREDNPPAGPPVIGVVGGLAGGKSTVARLLQKRGAAVVDADEIAHRVLRRPDVREKLRRAFGGGILGPDGEVRRDALAREVFGNPERIEELNSIVHPPVIRETRRRRSKLLRRADLPLVVLDAALLMEVGREEELCDALIFVDAPTELRRRRACEKRGLSPEQFRQRAAAQMPPEKKKERADFVVENTGTIQELDKQVERLWPALCGLKGGALTNTPPA